MPIDRRRMLKFLVVGFAFSVAPLSADAAAASSILVFKDPTCGCCSNWVKHIEANGFSVTVKALHDLDALKRSLGIPDALRSCHTATIAGYVLEGHVPAREIRRLLVEKPSGRGLAVPGMPVGSPGMEVDGETAGPYEVYLIGPDGLYDSFATYR